MDASTEGLTTFPLSQSIPNSPLSPEDTTFSILPRYLLEKVKNTFVSSASTHDGPLPGSTPNHSSTTSPTPTSSLKHANSRQPSSKSKASAASRTVTVTDLEDSKGTLNSSKGRQGHGHATRDSRGTTARNPRLASLSGNRRAAAPILSKSSSDVSASFTPYTHSPSHGYASNPLSRSQSRSLGTLPESPVDSSPPPPYSADPQNQFSSIPGFPLNRDANEDAKSVSSIAASNLGVTQVFRRLRGEALSRDYWMADESAVDCYDCNTTFTTWRRKHHCRVCGRIFCSRCASNIIPGARFGHEGLVRVCNLCLAILSHRANARLQDHAHPTTNTVNAADENGSVVHDRPGMTSSPSVANMNISLPLETSFRAPQSQFSASVLFPRNDFSTYHLAGNLSSEDVSQLIKRSRRFSDASLVRPETPDMFDDNASPQPWHPAFGSPVTLGRRGSIASSHAGRSPIPTAKTLMTPAPFRMTAAEEDRPLPSPDMQIDELQHQPDHIIFCGPSDGPVAVHQQGSEPSRARGLGIYPAGPTSERTLPHSTTSASDLHETSYEASMVGGTTTSSGRPETPSAHTFSMPPIRSRLTSRAADQVFDFGDIDARRLSEANYLPSMFSSQAKGTSFVSDVELATAALGHVRRLLQQCLRTSEIPKGHLWEEVLLKILVEIARWPLPRTEDGDSMDVRKYIKIKRVPGGSPKDSEYVDGVVFTKSILNKALPRFIANPRIMVFDYAFEFEHDEHKLARLDSLRDSEKDSLRKLANSIIDHRPHIVLVSKGVSGLALDYLHKANVIVVRNVKPSVLQAVARCTQAGVYDTYQHFPETTKMGRCQAFRADTIVHKLIPGQRKTLLRFDGCSKELGATIILRGADLATLSKIKRIMRFMTLAVYSLRLEMCLLWDEHAAIPPAVELARLREMTDAEELENNLDFATSDLQRDTARMIAKASRPYITTILSSSPTVIYPPPHALARLQTDNVKVQRLVIAQRHSRDATVTAKAAVKQPNESLAAPVMDSTKGGEPEAALQTSNALTRSLSEVSLLSVKPAARTKALTISANLAAASEIGEAEQKRNEHLRIWENRLARHQDILAPSAHQHITTLEAVICTTTLKACHLPHLSRKYYYHQDSDLTLRQFIHNTVQASGQRCLSRGCDKPMLAHYTTYAHGQLRLHVVLEPYIFAKQHEEDILLWSYCKVCQLSTDVTSLSREAANYSFAKYMEISFYSDQLFCRVLACPHNIHQDHMRYFAYKNMAIRIFVDRIDVSDVVIPPLRLRIDAWTQLRIKNEEYKNLEKAVTTYWDSVMARIRSFNYDLLATERFEAGKQAMQELEEKAIQDREAFLAMVDAAYEDVPVSQPSQMNTVRHALQKKVVSWDTEFINFEQKFIPSDAERAKRMTSSHLRRLFSDPNSSVPPSPDFRSTFSPLPSLPTSPLLTATPFPPVQEHVGARQLSAEPSSMGPADRATPTSDARVSHKPADKSGSQLKTDDPALRLTQENLSQLAGNDGVAPPIAADAQSVIDHGETSQPVTRAHSPGVAASNIRKERVSESDSDSTVCAEPPKIHTAFQALEGLKSESEDLDTGLAMRPYRIRKPKPVPSIANLVERFEGPRHQSKPVSPAKSRRTSPLASTDHIPRSVMRPGMKRGKSDYTEVRNRARMTANDGRGSPLSDGDLPSSEAAPRPGRLQKISKSASRLPLATFTRHGPRRPATERTMSRSSSTLSVPEQERPAIVTRRSTASSHSTVTGDRAALERSDAPLKPSRTTNLSVKVGGRDARSSARPSPMAAAKVSSRRAPPGPSTGTSNGTRVSTMTRHFNHLNREAERERQRQLLIARGRRARPVAVPRATANVFVSSKEALKDDSDDEGSSSGADDELDPDDEEDKSNQPQEAPGTSGGVSDAAHSRSSTLETYMYEQSSGTGQGAAFSTSSTSSSLSILSSEGSASTNPAASSSGNGTDSTHSILPSPHIGATTTFPPRLSHLSESEMSSTGGTEKQSLMKTLSSLWNYRGADFTPLEYPITNSEHLLEGSNILLREDEPSSMIAHCLDSKLYKKTMKENQEPTIAATSTTEAFMPEQPAGHGGNRGSNWDVLEMQTEPGTDLEEAMKKSTDRHLRLSFDDSTLRCTMKVFFADQFAALRRNCDCEELFIESLARCVKWDAIGGKSGSTFLKTKDDRFIIKEISPPEMNALLQFAPKYFEYMSRAFFQDLPTVLAKILGVFRISFRNAATGNNKKLDVLVMENIFYNKNITTQFDLKGSTRNRHAEVVEGKACVLLDENLNGMAYDTPLYVREHTKKHLEAALHNDSLFLANQKIMDYSLIVGVDKDSLELVVGIIDFLRPYTWDKRLETWVKETAYIGGGNREPTVLNPKIYKARFREAMSRYFLLVPDRWTSQAAVVEDEKRAAATAGQLAKQKATNASNVDDQSEVYAAN